MKRDRYDEIIQLIDDNETGLIKPVNGFYFNMIKVISDYYNEDYKKYNSIKILQIKEVIRFDNEMIIISKDLFFKLVRDKKIEELLK